MSGTVIRPSFKFIQLGFIFVIVLIIAAAVVHYEYLSTPSKNQPPWLPAVAALFILWPISRAVRRHFTKMVIEGDRLYYESGAMSKQTRIIQIPKVQDVRVHQSLSQRMFGVGDLSIETAGEASRLTISNVDRPRALAEQILELTNREHDTPHL